ncbi:chaperone (DUF2930) isoform X1 [Wolffia australiana]
MAWQCCSIVNPNSGFRCPDGAPHRRRRSNRSFSRKNFVVNAIQNDSAEGDPRPLNLSVLRFTLGIPGLDESYLPRYIGFAFGSLVVLNHFFGSGSPTPAQLRSEALGIGLAAFSIALPYFGKFLKGSSPVDRSIIPEGNRQIFAITEDTSPAQKEEFAWASYVLLQNTNSISVLILCKDKLCIRGYWNFPEDASKAQILDLFWVQIQEAGLTRIRDPLYFPLGSDSLFIGMLPSGAQSMLLQPVASRARNTGDDEDGDDAEGFVLLVSNAAYAYRDSDRAWIKAAARKFRGLDEVQ